MASYYQINSYSGSGTELSFPTSIDDIRVALISSNAFKSNTTLTKVACKGVLSINIAAFSGCTNLSSVYFPECVILNDYAFQNCSALSSVSFPKLTYMGTGVLWATPFHMNQIEEKNYAEYSNSFNNYLFNIYSDIFSSFTGSHTFIAGGTAMGKFTLKSIDFPNCSFVGNSAFTTCIALSNVSLPNCTYLDDSAFTNCSALSIISLPKCSYLGLYAFKSCWSLKTVYLTSTSMCNINYYCSYIFQNAGLTSTQGSIYVPSSLVTTYQNNAAWSYFSTRFIGV